MCSIFFIFITYFIFWFRVGIFIFLARDHMTAMYFPFRHFVSRPHGGRTACRAATDALEILSNLRPGFTRNVIPRINSSTAVSVSQANSGERQVNDEELQANETE